VTGSREAHMPFLYVVGGIVSLLLLVYLTLALLKPELFQ
jgi:K+-transporting ATPase KdpF subunit